MCFNKKKYIKKILWYPFIVGKTKQKELECQLRLPAASRNKLLIQIVKNGDSRFKWLWWCWINTGLLWWEIFLIFFYTFIKLNKYDKLCGIKEIFYKILWCLCYIELHIFPIFTYMLLSNHRLSLNIFWCCELVSYKSYTYVYISCFVFWSKIVWYYCKQNKIYMCIYLYDYV